MRGILVFCRVEALRFESRCKKYEPFLNGTQESSLFQIMWTIRPKVSEYQHAKDEAQKRFLRIPADQKDTLYSLLFSDARSRDPWGESEVCKLRDFVNGLSPQVPDFKKAGSLALAAL